MALQRLPLDGDLLRILLVSDIHLEMDMIHRLGVLLEKREETIDLIFLSGDIANLHDIDRDNADIQAATEGDISFVISALESICPRVLYIPGNHDPDSTLSLTNDLPRLTPNSENIHGKVKRVAKNLVIYGFGGSSPSYLNGNMAWKGYPYSSDESLGQDIERTYRQNLSEERVEGKETITPADQVIFMTHTGPAAADTTHYPTYEETIQAGCQYLTNILKEKDLQKQVLINIHGHIHRGYGQSRIQRIPVVNPGSLKEGRSVLLTLAYSPIKEKWETTSTEFVYLS